MHTLPRNNTGHTLYLFFVSFMRSNSALCHLRCKTTCSLRTDKQLGNMTSVVENSKIVTAQQLDLGDDHAHHAHHTHFFLPELISGAPRPPFLWWKMQDCSRRFAREYPPELWRETRVLLSKH